MYQALAIFAAGMLFASISGAILKRLKTDLLRTRFWLPLIAAAVFLSAASALVETTRHAGTGLTTSYGWPKPFYFRYLSETGGRSGGWEFIYFAGNCLVFLGGLLMLSTIWRLARRWRLLSTHCGH
jgi:hypothetical protein